MQIYDSGERIIASMWKGSGGSTKIFEDNVTSVSFGSFVIVHFKDIGLQVEFAPAEGETKESYTNSTIARDRAMTELNDNMSTWELVLLLRRMRHLHVNEGIEDQKAAVMAALGI